MELIWKESQAVRLICEAEAILPAEGLLPPPEGRTVREVLCCTADAAVDSVRLESGRAELDGRLTVSVTALDETGSVFAFESSAGFTHSLGAEGAEPGMSAMAQAAVTELQAKANDGGAAFVSGIRLSVTVYSPAPIRVIGGINGIDDLELRSRQTAVKLRRELGSRTLHMREELAEAGVAEVISCCGQTSVRDVTAERDGTVVSGVLTVSAIISDGEGRTAGLVRQIPFRERLDINADRGEVYCRAGLRSIGVHALGEEFALLAMEAEIVFELYSVVDCELALTTDAFSPTMGFDCLYDDISLLSCEGRYSAQTQIKETLDLPTGMTEISYPLFASARPVITSVDAEAGETIISGVLVTAVIYASAAGNVYSYTEDIPFSLPLTGEFKSNMPKPSCSCAVQITGGTERTLQLVYNLQTDIELYNAESARYVAGLAEKELEKRDHGLIIAFSSEGDGFYDIAKRYSVSTESVQRLNPEQCEPMKEGDRLLLIV